ncbi:hypodermin-B-like [Aphidius gifuensis]|uniref:hypodermin-B-like n=1 Tax=Aphidius gifuensis TaxID=684658 RepID=UPI001CDB652F|nr:hypodermin-B-like [Aphidius gifuensis]
MLRVNGNLPKKIYGGNTVSIIDNPWQVSIQIRNQHICGGAIISMNFVLTAASCVTSQPNIVYGNIEVLSGTNDLTKNSEDLYWKIHENYNPHINWINDIAILKLSSSLYYSIYRQKAGFPVTITNRALYRLTGWGNNPETNLMSRYLQQINVKTISPKICRPQYYKEYYLGDSQHCLFPRITTAQITWGNGGSPVMMARKIIGIISTIPLDSQQYPVIYTFIRPYIDWIKEIEKKFEC